MTEKSTGGSADLIKGTIELIHNRRLLFQDDGGLDVPFNEEGTDLLGISYNSRYYLHIFDYVHQRSK
jgi:hypothetical protein